MSQLTKKTKWVLGGLVGFALVATTATTLATWVIGENSGSDNKTGNVTVSDKTEDSVALSLNDVAYESGATSVVFGPKAGDDEGFVKSSGATAEEEHLTFTISGTVTYGYSFQGLTFTFEVVNNKAKVDELVTKNYITLPTASIEKTKAEVGVSGSTFSVAYSFGWGSAFGGENPSLYFDDSTSGTVTKDVATAQSVYTELKNALDGATFKVTVTSK
ncbi:MAG: hypothetical protein ACI31I_05345 [Bacilli bacterium]